VYEELSSVEKSWNQFLEKLDLLMKRNTIIMILKQEQSFLTNSYS
jgi:hypothetical protein